MPTLLERAMERGESLADREGASTKPVEVFDDGEQFIVVLAAEVRRLRDVVETYERDNCENIQTIVDLRAALGLESTLKLKTTAELLEAKLERIAELADVWREEEQEYGCGGESPLRNGEECADELEELLK